MPSAAIHIRVSTVIDAQANQVWDDIRQIASHVEWMKDAVSIEFDQDGPGEGSEEVSNSETNDDDPDDDGEEISDSPGGVGRDRTSGGGHDGPNGGDRNGESGGNPAREGIGVRFSCRTKVGPIVLNDRMEVTEWVDGRLIGIRHQGLVTGEGRLWINPVDDARTEVVWEEQLVFPLRLGGPIGARLARPILHRIWTGNLSRLSTRF